MLSPWTCIASLLLPNLDTFRRASVVFSINSLVIDDHYSRVPYGKYVAALPQTRFGISGNIRAINTAFPAAGATRFRMPGKPKMI